MTLSKPISSGGVSSGSTPTALFFDQRDNANAQPQAVAEKWWTRLFNTEDHNDISSDVELLSWSIAAVNHDEGGAGSDYFQVVGDQTTYFPAGHRFDVRGSTGNDSDDTPWIVTEPTFDDPNTFIVVTADITDSTVDGTIHNGMIKFITSKKYNIQGHAEAYYTYGSDVRLANIASVTYTAGYVTNTPGTMTDPLSAIFTNLTAIPMQFRTQIEPGANSIWEVQQWGEKAYNNAGAQGTRQTAAGHGGVATFASIEIQAST